MSGSDFILSQRVLLVDDDRELLEAIGDLLRVEGYEVMLASSGKDALALLGGSQLLPDLVLLDLWMPEMDGGRLAATLRKDERTARLPIVALTAAGPDEVQGLEVDWYLQKPLKIDALLGTVAHYCRGLPEVA